MIKPLPLYVINLSQDIERWKSVLSETKDLGFTTHRINAVNYHELNMQDFVSPGVHAVWLSHIKAMQEFLASDSEIAIIAEDDFHLIDKNELFAKILALSESKWDLVQLGFLKPGFDTRIKVSIANLDSILFKIVGLLSKIPLFSKFNFASRMRVKQSLQTPAGFIIDDCQPGAHFYIVKRDFCKKIINLNSPQFLSIDDFYTALSKMRTFKMLRVKRSLVSQKPFSAWSGSRFKREL